MYIKKLDGFDGHRYNEFPRREIEKTEKGKEIKRRNLFSIKIIALFIFVIQKIQTHIFF